MVLDKYMIKLRKWCVVGCRVPAVVACNVVSCDDKWCKQESAEIPMTTTTATAVLIFFIEPAICLSMQVAG